MENFSYKSLLAQRKMSLDELNKYYRELRRYEYELDLPIKGIALRKKIYFLVKIILKIDHLLSSRTVTIIGDQRIKNDKPKIYACTHIGRYDIESAIEAINESVWFIMGDPGQTYRNLDGLILRLNGVSWFDMGNTEELRNDAHTVNARQIKILENGGNEMCFPEAAWNIDSTIPVGDLHYGFVKRALKTGAEIIPIAIEQYRDKNIKNYYVNIGKNIDLSMIQNPDATLISENIRSIMGSLKWDIWEKHGRVAYDKTKSWDEKYDEFIDFIMCDTENGYTVEEINRTKYVLPDKRNRVNEQEAFSHLNNLEMNSHNAFLAKVKK